MTARLNPYILFKGQARAALEFYHSVFGGDLTVSTHGEMGNPDPAVADWLMHGQLETTRGFTLMASDTPPGMEHTDGNNIVISLSGDEDTELRGYWDKLATAGDVTLPLEKQIWGAEFGQVTDQFGISWMVNIGPQ